MQAEMRGSAADMKRIDRFAWEYQIYYTFMMT
jgi:hypothetical protein